MVPRTEGISTFLSGFICETWGHMGVSISMEIERVKMA